MLLSVRLATAGLLDINATLLVELVAFILMVVVLARYAYPRVLAEAERRQRALTEQLEAAEKERQEAQKRLDEAEERLREASRHAQEIVDNATRAGEEIRQGLRERGEQESGRMIERAKREIEGERQRALDSIRGEVADLVVGATQKVIGESLDDRTHRKLIDDAIAQVGDGRHLG